MAGLMRAFGIIALAGIALLAGSPAALALPEAQAASPVRAILPASVDDFEIESFDAEYSLGRDAEGRSTLHTIERITARFPDFDQNRGLIRDLPRVFDAHSTELAIVSVTDGRGAPRAFTTSEDGDFLSVTMAVPEGSYVHGAQSYIIEYTQRDVTKLYDDTGADEFYWDVNGTGWRQPFGQVSAHLTVSDDLRAALSGTTACYRGYMGSGDHCELADADGSFTVAETELGPYENVTLAVGFAPNTFSAPPVPFLERIPLLLYGGVASALGGVLLTIVLGIRNRRGARTGRAIIAQYEPPEGISIAVSAELLGAEKQAMTATLLDLAVRRKIQLLYDAPTEQYGARPIDLDALLPLEVQATSALFRGSKDVSSSLEDSEPVWFSPTSTRLGDAAAALRQGAAQESLALGFKRKPRRGPAALIPILFLLGLALGVLHAWLLGSEGAVIAVFVVGVNLIVWLSIGAVAIATSGKPRTHDGALLHDHLMGLREYVRLAETDRIRMLQSASGAKVDSDRIVQVYELLLPYAVLFGYETEWQGELARYYATSAPEWVGGSADFSRGIQLSAFHGFVAASPVTHTASSSSFGSGSGSGSSFSSSSGGSSGGGFSGGGGGGGGGGGI